MSFNAKENLRLLQSLGIKYEMYKNYRAVSVGDYDFYPVTEMWKNRETGVRGSGVSEFINKVKE